MSKVYKDPAATALCDQIRWLYNINPDGGWIARPHHGNKEIRIGHPDYGKDENITRQVDTLFYTINTLNLCEKVGYTLVITS